VNERNYDEIEALEEKLSSEGDAMSIRWTN